MKFRNIKIIEDKNDMLEPKKIRINQSCLFIGPTDIQDIEEWEYRLDRCQVPYVTAQFETTLQRNERECEEAAEKGKKINPDLKYARGYGIFVEKKNVDALNEAGFNEVRSIIGSTDDEEENQDAA